MEEPSSPAFVALGYSAGLGQDPVALSRNANIDEQEAIAACQEEWLASTRRHVKRKERQEMASRCCCQTASQCFLVQHQPPNSMQSTATPYHYVWVYSDQQ
jgi:hypothetical protein